MEESDMKKRVLTIACKVLNDFYYETINSNESLNSHVGAASPTTPQSLLNQLKSPGRYN
jgi:protein-L-isoaspartate O-methyltransferase